MTVRATNTMQTCFDFLVKRVDELWAALDYPLGHESDGLQDVIRFAAFKRFTHAGITFLEYLEIRSGLSEEELEKAESEFELIISTAGRKGVISEQELPIVEEILDMIVDFRCYDDEFEIDEDLMLEEVYDKHSFLKSFIAGELARGTHNTNRATPYER